MKKIDYKGKEISVQEVEVITSNEPWNEYQLANGKLLAVKTILVEVAEAPDEKTTDGESLYLVKTQNIVKVK